MRFYLGTHETSWLRLTSIPLFISAIRLRRRKTRFPQSKGKWALDSGGFSELNKTGTWSVTAKAYSDEVSKWMEEIGSLEWAAIQDWMCEPIVLKKTGKTVLDHQRLTIQNYHDLIAIDGSKPWIPVVQGWEFDDYLKHVEMYYESGVDLRKCKLVGIGSVCRRQDTLMVESLIKVLATSGIKVHGFGFKIDGLKKCSRWLESADSLSWSFYARRVYSAVGSRMCDENHKGSCASCFDWAGKWRKKVLSAIDTGYAQPDPRRSLFDHCDVINNFQA